MHPAHASLSTTSSLGRTKLEQHIANWDYCERCPLHAVAQYVVIGRGTLPCDILFIGEAPGPREDAAGKPFVGPCKALIDDLISSSIYRLRRTYKIKWNYTYAFTNVVGCFPKLQTPGTLGRTFREPKNSEIHACSPRLREFAALACPRGLVLLGSTASEHGESPITSLFPKIAVHRMQHPTQLLRVGGLASKHYKSWLSGLTLFLANLYNDQPSKWKLSHG